MHVLPRCVFCTGFSLGMARVGLLCPRRLSSVPCSEGCAAASSILSESDMVLTFTVGAVEGLSVLEVSCSGGSSSLVEVRRSSSVPSLSRIPPVEGLGGPSSESDVGKACSFTVGAAGGVSVLLVFCSRGPGLPSCVDASPLQS